MSVTTAATTGGACCCGRGCSGTQCAEAISLEPQVDRFNGFQIAAGSEQEAQALAAQLEGGVPGAVRLGSPAEVAAAVPHFFGFHPDASVVVLGLSRARHDCRASISHGLRVDLAAAIQGPAAFGRWAAGRLLEAEANEALCVIYPPEGGPARMADYRRLVAGMCTPLRVAGVPPLDVLFVADGRWWSFLCDTASCCPTEGSAVENGVSAIAALSAYSGLAVLPSRAALAASLEPYGPEMAERMRAACDAALGQIAAEHDAPPAQCAAPQVHGRAFDAAAARVEDRGLGDGTGVPFYPALRSGLVLGSAPAQDGLCDSPHALNDPCQDGTGSSEDPRLSDLRGVGQPCGELRDSDSDDDDQWGGPCGTVDGGGEATGPAASGGSRPWTRQHAQARILDFDWDDVARAWQLADSLCDGQVPPDRALTDEAAGALLVALSDVRVRDYLATWCGDDRAGQAVALSVELARRAVTTEQAAAAYSIAAWAAWALGWGAWSRLCLERATNAVPDYALAGLIKQGLERGVGPELVREAARGTARRLDEMRADHEAARERDRARQKAL
jgi:hypothetical protein